MEKNKEEKKIPLAVREEMISKIAKTKEGQMLREWMLDLINQIESIKTIPKDVFAEGGTRMNEEVIGRFWAAQYLTAMVNKLLSLKEEKVVKKTSFK